jgi:hypothetical protein
VIGPYVTEHNTQTDSKYPKAEGEEEEELSFFFV